VSLVTLAEAKLHCRVDTSDEDSLLQGYIDAAVLAVENILDRRVYADAVAQGADTSGIVINAAIRSAILLLVGHYYAHREAVIGGQPQSVAETPLAVRFLLSPYRRTWGL
jgi:uncharacterized phage protein (predicted DNA packaging)